MGFSIYTIVDENNYMLIHKKYKYQNFVRKLLYIPKICIRFKCVQFTQITFG